MISRENASIVLGMLERGDKQHDIAAYFGENPGRIIDVKFARKPQYVGIKPAPAHRLPVKAGGHPYMQTTTTSSTVALLINDTMDLVDQLEVLEELIRTTPPNSPSVIIRITPALAEVILERYNTKNRKPKQTKIKRFALHMTDDGWYVTGDNLKFDTDGILRDGQNRLRGCIVSGVPFTTHVVFAIPPEAFDVLDSGTVRSAPDTFVVAGVPNPELSGKATRWLVILEKKLDRGVSIANADLWEHYQKRLNKEMLQRAITRAKKASKIIPTGTLAAMLYMMERKDADTAKIFAYDLEGAGRRGGRTLVSVLRQIKESNLGRMHESTITALTMKMWNGYRAGKPLRREQLRGDKSAEDHPSIE
jgi:hypothetical protein